MKHYVLGFVFNQSLRNIVLIKKARPTWQKGLLNGVGGKTEYYEFPESAMVREFLEEAGTATIESDWHHVLSLSYTKAKVEIYTLASDLVYCKAFSNTDEEIVRIKAINVNGYEIVNNLPQLISLSLQRLSDIAGEQPNQ